MSVLMTLGQRLTPKNVTLGVIMTNMVCRPTITLSNKQLPEETRRYTATREFFTEFFGFATTYSFASLIEKYVPKIVAKKFFKTDLTPKLIDTIKKTGWDKLTVVQKNLKGVILGSSFVATALAVAVLTPLLNNLVLNRMLSKIMGKKGKESKKPEAPAGDTFVKNTPPEPAAMPLNTQSAAFNSFLQNYLAAGPMNSSR